MTEKPKIKIYKSFEKKNQLHIVENGAKKNIFYELINRYVRKKHPSNIQNWATFEWF